MKLAFLGLGVMGFPMAGHLATAGHDVCVYNRSGAKAQRWLEVYKGRAAETPAQAARDAQICFLCVGADKDVREVLLGAQGALSTLAPGATVVDHTTASAALARDMAAQCRDLGLGFIDAPVSGGQAGAENGALTVMAGGDAEVFAKVEGVMQAYARCARLLGDVGCGQLAKMVNQVCIAGVVQGLAEAMLFSETVGLNTAEVIDVIRQGAAQSWQMENRFETMLAGQYEHGFAVDWMRKDLAMVLDEATRQSLTLPVTSLVDTYYAEVQQMGGHRWDTSSLFARLNAQQGKKSGDEANKGAPDPEEASL